MSDVFIGGGFWLLSASWPPLYQAQKDVIMYWRLAKAEERDSLAAFGDRYAAYMRVTPAFVPRLRPRRDDEPHAAVSPATPSTKETAHVVDR